MVKVPVGRTEPVSPAGSQCWMVILGIINSIWSPVEGAPVTCPQTPSTSQSSQLTDEYLLNSGSSTRLYGMRLTAALCNGAVRGQPVDSHVIICHTSVTCERHSHVCIYTTLGV